MQGLLYKTKCTVIGPMQYANGRAIRNYFKEGLAKLDITVFDHYHKPFLNEYIKENEELGGNLKKWMENEEYDKVAEYRAVRAYDLNLIDKSDWIIFHYIPGVITVGSWEEFFWGAGRLKKPTFFITETGKKNTPIWVMWTIKHKYIYNTKEEVLEMIKRIDSREVTIDSDRWRLLDYQYR